MSNVTSSAYPVVTVSKAGDQFTIVQGGQFKKLTRQGLADYIETLAPNTFIALTDGPGSYVGQQGKAAVVNSTEDGIVFEATTAGNFLALSDTPSGYGGNATRLAVVKADETGLEFINNTLIKLEDTPSTYAGSSEYFVKVNTAANALEFVAASEAQTTGWAQYNDGTYTEGSPFSVSVGVTADLPNDAATIIDDQLPTDTTSLYDGTVITPANENDFYIISIRMKVKSSVVEGEVQIDLDIGGGLGVIIGQTVRLRNGSGNENELNFTFPVYAGATFLANGGTVKITSVNGTTTVYDINYAITRTHQGR